MMPTSIDGTDITGATIDGQDVQEITVDGDTVFTAAPAGAFDLSQFPTTPTNTHSVSKRLHSLTIIPDGTEIYAANDDDNNFRKYSLATPFDVSSITGATNVSVGFNVGEGGPEFSPDGLKMYAVEGDSSRDLLEFDLSSAFDVTTASFVRRAKPSPLDSPRSIAIASDGTHIAVADIGLEDWVSFTLSTPFELSGFSFDGKFDDGFRPDGITYNNDGSKVYLGERGTGPPSAVFQYDLTTPFDATGITASPFTFSVNRPEGIAFSPNGDNFYVYDAGNDEIKQFIL